MRWLGLFTVTIGLGGLLAGCSEDLTSQMQITEGAKTRPLAVVCEPPEAMPGDTVMVTTSFYEPDPTTVEVSWRLALDYRFDLYGDLETEGTVLDLDEMLFDLHTTIEDQGLIIQSFKFTVPDSTLLVSSALPEVIDEPLPPSVVALMEPAHADAVTKAEMASFLATVDPTSLSPEEATAVQGISDVFACQVRLRAKVRSGLTLDITRNLTVRYSRRFGSLNVNENVAIERIGIIGVQYDDLEEREDIGLFPNDTTWVYHTGQPGPVSPRVSVQSGFTYFVYIDVRVQNYLSPAGYEHEEQAEQYWYYTTLDPVALVDGFYVNDTGDQADDMYVIDDIETVRIAPPIGSGPKLIRMYVVARDYRPEWRMYHATPGAAFQYVDVLFE